VVVLAGDGHDGARLTRHALVVAAIAGLSAMLMTSCSDDPGPGAVAVYGDSLAVEAEPYMKLLAAADDRPLEGSWYLGAAPCDWVNAVNEEAQRKPAYAVFAFAGNKGNSCGTATSGPALVDNYEQTLRGQIQVMLDAGADVILVGPPDFDLAGYTEDAPLLREMMQGLADEFDRTTYVDGRKYLSPDGFVMQLPCLDDEGADKGCVDGRITVRNTDGVHFDVPGADNYSSGAYRWAKTIFERVN
jgi:hypothetical protein